MVVECAHFAVYKHNLMLWLVNFLSVFQYYVRRNINGCKVIAKNTPVVEI